MNQKDKRFAVWAAAYGAYFALSGTADKARAVADMAVEKFDAFEDRQPPDGVPASELSKGTNMNEDQIKRVVDRFLSWQLPKNFAPDGGITYKHTGHPYHSPTGTNLFSATQADEMVRHMVEGLAMVPASESKEGGE